MNGLLIFIAGIGIFLFGIKQIEQALRDLGNAPLLRAMQHFTRTPLHGAFLGVIATAILQSSSVVGLLTLAFVGAGIFTLKHAIGIILGANLGTTMTGWIVTLIGFKLNLTDYYLPLIGLSALGLTLLSPGRRIFLACQVLLGLGLLLMGLVLMKDSVGVLEHYFDINRFSDYPLIVFFIAGFVFTAVIQSSSATMMITLSAMNAGLIELPAAAALIIGADLGTTSTVIIGALQGQIVKRQVALAHFGFNLIVDVLAMLCLPALLYLVVSIYAIDDPLYALVALHSSFNLLGLCLFLPFAGAFQQIIERILPFKSSGHGRLTVMQVPLDVPAAALEAVDKDALYLMDWVLQINSRRLLRAQLTDYLAIKCYILYEGELEQLYQSAKSMEGRLTDYLINLQRQPLTEDQALKIQQRFACLRDTLYAAKALKDVDKDIALFLDKMEGDNIAPVHTVMQATLNFYKRCFQVCRGEIMFSTELAAELQKDIVTTHAQFNHAVYALLNEQKLSDAEASTAFNMNRELLIAGHSLLGAMENYWLSFAEVKTLSDILSMGSGRLR